VRLSCENLIELRSGDYTAKVAPTAGGRIASLIWRKAGASFPLLVEWDGRPFDEHDWPKAGAFPMLPFANRLPREGFRFRGRVFRPEPGPAGFALHGFAHRRAWNVVESSRDRSVMRWAHEGLDAGWPWAWSAQQQVELGECGMTVTINVRNESTEPMPLAMGWHPYHPVGPDVAHEDLQFVAGARRDLDAQGSAEDHDRKPSFAMRRGETAAFTQWSGRVRLCAHARGVIAVACQGGSLLILHRPDSGDYVCAEPITLLPGHLGREPNSLGRGVLQPGETQRLSWSCGFEPASRRE
jgi:aldose 1-epimerase